MNLGSTCYLCFHNIFHLLEFKEPILMVIKVKEQVKSGLGPSEGRLLLCLILKLLLDTI